MVDHPATVDETPAVAPEDSDEPRHEMPAPVDPYESGNEQPEDDVADRHDVTPAPSAGPDSTILTNSIEPDARGSTTEPSEDERRESLGESAENFDQVEVFDSNKPARITGEDRYKYKTDIPEVRRL